MLVFDIRHQASAVYLFLTRWHSRTIFKIENKSDVTHQPQARVLALNLVNICLIKFGNPVKEFTILKERA